MAGAREGLVRCPGCGARYPAVRLRCPACGDPNPRQAREPLRGPGALLAAALVVFLGLIVAAVVYFLWH